MRKTECLELGSCKNLIVGNKELTLPSASLYLGGCYTPLTNKQVFFKNPGDHLSTGL